MGEGDDSGGGEMSLEQQQMILENTVMGVAEMIGPLCPHLNDDALLSLSEHVVREQLGPIMNEILPSIYDEETVAEYPSIVVTLTDKDGNDRIDVWAPKRLDSVKDTRDIANHALILGLLVSPGVRAMVKAFGFTYQFKASKQDVVTRIHTAH